MSSVAVLNASFEPLGVVTLHRAMMYLVRDRVTVVEAVPGQFFRSATESYAVPLVVQFRTMVKVPYLFRTQTWTRHGVLVRDSFRCIFCQRAARTIDHLLPVSRKGPNSWRNTAASCLSCNSKKGARTPAEAGMPLRFQPHEVTSRDTLLNDIAATGANMVMLGLV